VLRLEQGRDHTDLKRPKEHRPIDKADRQAGGRLAVGSARLPRAAAMPGAALWRAIPPSPEGADQERSARHDLPLRCKALQVEHPQDIFNPDHGDLEISIEPPFPCKSQRACAFRYDVGLLDPRLDDLEFRRCAPAIPSDVGAKAWPKSHQGHGSRLVTSALIGRAAMGWTFSRLRA